MAAPGGPGPTPVAQRKITLRNVKGSALTYVEMDRNLSSFFHSASLNGTDLLLHYTGSSVLGAPYTPTSVTVPLNPLLATITQLTVAGNNVGDIQYRINNSTLGADSSFKWDTVNYRLGVGKASPVATLDVMQLDAANPSRIRITTQDIKSGNRIAALELYQGNTFIGSFGKTNASRPDIYTIVGDGTRSAYTTIGTTNVVRVMGTGVGILLPSTTTPNKALTVVGEIGVGTNTGGNQGILGSIITPASAPGGKVPLASLPSSAGQIGLLIESPYSSGISGTGGHVVVGINTTGPVQNTAFSVVAGGGGYYTIPILTAVATGKIGINKVNPVQALDIVGNTTMTGNINIDGTATIVTVADSLGANPKVLTVNGTGLVEYSNNLMPRGGIIMWGGTIPNIPTGWRLCDGNNGTVVNGVTIPDLRERFIVGAGGTGDSLVATRIYDRTGSNYSDHTFMYYGGPVMDFNDKVNTETGGDAYFEYYNNDPAKITANGDPTGTYHMYNTGGNYFYYINNEGNIEKGNTLDNGIRYYGSPTTPFAQTNVNNNPGQPANWSGDTYYARIDPYSQAYGYYHVYQKKFSTNNIAATGNNLWYWIFDKRHQNYTLVKGTFNGDASIGTAAGAYYKTGPATGFSYTPFQKYKNPGVPTTDANTNRPIIYHARRLQVPGVVWPEGGYNVGDKAGFSDIQLTNATMPSHTHIAQRWTGAYGPNGNGPFANGYGYRNNTRITSTAGGDQPHENKPPYYALAFIIYTGS
jgi:hypothetical protein